MFIKMVCDSNPFSVHVFNSIYYLSYLHDQVTSFTYIVIEAKKKIYVFIHCSKCESVDSCSQALLLVVLKQKLQYVKPATECMFW